MVFEWDENKELKNIKKHGIDFNTALHVFGDPFRIVWFDEEHSDDEDRYIMIIRTDIDPATPLNDEQIKKIEDLDNRPVVFDEDSRELTDEELSEFKRVSDIRREERRKQVVTLRLSPQALSKAKSLGKGYTSVLSRLLEEALNDKDMIRRCL